jgi:hypothetical protein
METPSLVGGGILAKILRADKSGLSLRALGW